MSLSLICHDFPLQVLEASRVVKCRWLGSVAELNQFSIAASDDDSDKPKSTPLESHRIASDQIRSSQIKSDRVKSR